MNEYGANVRYNSLPTEKERVDSYVRESRDNSLLKKYDKTLVNGTTYGFFKFCAILLLLILIAMAVIAGYYVKGVFDGNLKTSINQKIDSFFNATVNNKYENNFDNNVNNDYELNNYNNHTIIVNNEINCP